MSEINWDLAPEGAVELKGTGKGPVRWFNCRGERFINNEWVAESHQGWKTIATRPQQKTVADAYEALKRQTIPADAKYAAVCKIRQSGWLEVGDFIFVGEGYDNELFEEVCTYEQFEAYAKEREAKQEGEKWTHLVNGSKCVLLDPDKDCDGYYITKTHYGAFELAKEHELKPIKPPLSKGEAIEILLVNKHLTVAQLMKDYDII